MSLVKADDGEDGCGGLGGINGFDFTTTGGSGGCTFSTGKFDNNDAVGEGGRCSLLYDSTVGTTTGSSLFAFGKYCFKYSRHLVDLSSLAI